MFTIIYFSPSGNALHLAKQLASHLDDYGVSLMPLEFTKPENLEKNKHLILLYPIHAFNAVRTVKRFVNGLPSGLYDIVSLLGVGSSNHWMNAAASLELRKILVTKGYPICIDEVLAMPLTLIVSFPEKLSLQLIEESQNRIKELSISLLEEKTSTKKVALKSRILSYVGKGEKSAARLFGLELHANNNCNSCGECWSNCPENNIKENKNGKPQFGFNCLMCMRCIYNCKQKAISPRFSKFIPITKGYSLDKLLKAKSN
jgi:ferredoxin